MTAVRFNRMPTVRGRERTRARRQRANLLDTNVMATAETPAACIPAR